MTLIIFGEIILDRYFISSTNRKAPEFDIPIYNVNKIEDKLGGASNVAFNLNKHTDILFISVLGNDDISKTIINILKTHDIKNKIFISNRKSIVKNRTICNNEIVHRLDYEDTYDIPDSLIEEILLYFQNIIKEEKPDGLIISDYNKGIIPHKLCRNLIELCNKNDIYTFIDPKVNDIYKYKNCTFIKPNLIEAKAFIPNIIDEYAILKKLYNEFECKYLLITKGSDGMIGYDETSIINIKHDNTINVVDVTGAGDIVISVFSYIYTKTKDFYFSSSISNYIAGKSVQTIGNYIFTFEDTISYNKIIHSNQIEIIKNLRKMHDFIVFTNGCFDIMHIGHLKLLKYCKSLGGILVIGLNSDSSIKQLKGNNRPINNETDRIEFIKLLGIVDYIIIFNELTPFDIIKNIQPDILVKGSDYCLENVIGREYSKKILFYELVENKSTTNIIKKIENNNNDNKYNP